MARAAPRPEPVSDAAVVAKAALRAAERLEIPGAVLARVLGLSEATLSRMRHGAYRPEPPHKAFELAVLFIRLFRGLDAVAGGDEAAARAWLRSENRALGAAPIVLIQTVAGLTDVLHYLDARRAVV